MRRIAIAALFGSGLVLATAAVAGAQTFPDDDPPNATGGCTARAELSNGVTVDPYVSGGVYEIPLTGSASYVATTPYSGPERPIEGFVRIKTPPGIPDITFDDKWVWDDDSTSTEDRDTVSWDFPSVMPRNVEMSVFGEHVDADGIRCAGSITIRFDGGFFDSPAAWVAVGGTVVSATGVALSAVSKVTTGPKAPPPGGATVVADPPPAGAPPGDSPPGAAANATAVDPDAPTIVGPPDPGVPTEVEPPDPRSPGGAS